MDDLMYVWPDGTYCDRYNLEDHLTFMSDDYEALTWDEFSKQYPEDAAEEV